MATLSLARVLHNSNVSAAITGATRPQQIAGNSKAAEVALDAELDKRIDDILAPVVERDPALLDTFAERP